MSGLAKRIGSSLSEKLASTWVLLSDTTNFLSRTSVFDQYEGELRALRQQIAAAKADERSLHEARVELIAMRAALRMQGYDLSLVSYDLSIKGFRNDAAVAEGYRRAVIFIGEKELWAIVGDENHRALHDYLESQCERRRISGILQKHYLWYRWNARLLLISGADSETAEDFSELQAWAEEPDNKLLLIGRMKKTG
jgi:hypothetical protein